MVRKIYKKIAETLGSDVIFPENRELVDRFGGRAKGYILGTSSSINDLNLTHLEGDAVKISVGNFHEHMDLEVINPDIHLFAGTHPPITVEVLTNWWTRCSERLPKETPVLVHRKDFEVARKIFKNRDVYCYKPGGNLPIDFTRQILSPWSVSVLAVQLSLYLGTKETYLLGIDHDWQMYKPYTHFYSHDAPSLEYYMVQEGIEVKKDNNRLQRPKEALYRSYELYQQHEQLKMEADRLGLSVFNGNVNSSFDVYERRDFHG